MDAAASGSGPLGPGEVTTEQLWAGFVAGVFPFVWAGYEFWKRIDTQQRACVDAFLTVDDGWGLGGVGAGCFDLFCRGVVLCAPACFLISSVDKHPPTQPPTQPPQAAASARAPGWCTRRRAGGR